MPCSGGCGSTGAMEGEALGETGRAGAGLGDDALRDRGAGDGVDVAGALRAVIAETGAGTVVAGAAVWALPGVEIFVVLREVNPESTESVFGMRSS